MGVRRSRDPQELSQSWTTAAEAGREPGQGHGWKEDMVTIESRDSCQDKDKEQPRDPGSEPGWKREGSLQTLWNKARAKKEEEERDHGPSNQATPGTLGQEGQEDKEQEATDPETNYGATDIRLRKDNLSRTTGQSKAGTNNIRSKVAARTEPPIASKEKGQGHISHRHVKGEPEKVPGKEDKDNNRMK